MPVTDRFLRVPLSQIKVNRERRQRREIDTKGLVDSVKRHGVLSPIVIDQDYVLIFGERRLTASLELGLPDIPVRFVEDMKPVELQILELEENIKRMDLDWQDLVRSTGQIHQLYCQLDPGWTLRETAEECCVTTGAISMHLRVFSELDDPRIFQSTTVREAYNKLQRRDQRLAGEAMQELLDTEPEEVAAPTETEEEVVARLEGQPSLLPLASGVPAGVPRTFVPGNSSSPPVARPLGPSYPAAEQTILFESFLQWAPKYTGKKFNLVHCDFPYGIDLFAGPQSGRDRGELSAYDDSKSTYLTLLESFCKNLDKFMALSAHLMFWYSAKHHEVTMKTFRELAPSLDFVPFPLIWVKSDNAGISSDSRMTPRHVYETCLMASRGKRNIVKIVADAYSAPTDKRLHMSTKPEPMLKHFMSMLVDEHTRLLDPTCGSGAALRAAEELGASAVLGMDIDEQAVGVSRVALKNARSLRTVSRSA